VAERSEAGWGGAQCIIDQGQNTLQIPVNVVVPETQYPEPLIRKIAIAFRVAAGMCVEVMLTAVDLDDEALLETDEIDDIAGARGLTAEMVSEPPP
jgi:hypothetical protein